MSKRKKTGIYDGELLDEELDPVEWEPGLEGAGLATDQPGITSYFKTYQGKGLNSLITTSSNTHNGFIIDGINHTWTLQDRDVLLIFDEQAMKNMTPQTSLVLLQLLEKVTAQLPHGNNISIEAIEQRRTVVLSLEEYMNRRKLNDTYEARKQLNKSIKALYGISLEFPEKVYITPDGKRLKKGMVMQHRLRITDHAITQEEGEPIKRGAAVFKFSFDMAKYLSYYGHLALLPFAIYTINTQYHPYSVQLAIKLIPHYRMNYRKTNRNTITVKSLLDSIPGIPRYEELSTKGKITERIIRPFDRDIAHLVEKGIISRYWYFRSDKVPIEGGDTLQRGGLSYADFSNLSIHFELNGYPDLTKWLEQDKKIGDGGRK